MESLAHRSSYSREVAVSIETLGSIAVSIANRWKLGWPDRVQVLLDENIYLINLEAQMNKEKDVLADAGHLQHLTHHEILEMHGVKLSPPTWAVVEKDGVNFIEGDAVSPLPTFVTKKLLSDHFNMSSPGTLQAILAHPLKK